MSYDGYLIKIDGNVFPMKYIVRDSWECTPDTRRILEEANDAYGIRHVRESTHTRTEITFKIGEHKDKDHEEIMNYFQKKNNVMISFYNDWTGLYQDGIFRLDDIKIKHKQSFDDELWYEETTIKYAEY